MTERTRGRRPRRQERADVRECLRDLADIWEHLPEVAALYEWAHDRVYAPGSGGGESKGRSPQKADPTGSLAAERIADTAKGLRLSDHQETLRAIEGLIRESSNTIGKVYGGLTKLTGGPLYGHLPAEGMVESLVGGEELRVVKREEVEAAVAAKARRERRGEGYGRS